jgi:hypothetical protein
MQENIAYIWPKRAVLYCDSQPSLPPLDDDNLKLPHRDIVSLSNAGFEIKEIAATVTNAPKARALRRAEISDAEETDRKPEASLCGRFSQRDQDYRQKLGTFSTSIRKEGSKKAVKIYNVLKDKSVAQLFHVSPRSDSV